MCFNSSIYRYATGRSESSETIDWSWHLLQKCTRLRWIHWTSNFATWRLTLLNTQLLLHLRINNETISLVFFFVEKWTIKCLNSQNLCLFISSLFRVTSVQFKEPSQVMIFHCCGLLVAVHLYMLLFFFCGIPHLRRMVVLVIYHSSYRMCVS